ncbi:hypothetical protein XELAEV_18009953mg [Xenopus laevis]|uniref:Caskin C-terminal domain-containing protein n=1 Tax=Xenopus laevis TaxID=8355 RepID=A0A974DVP4_XENLA|nr:hypothetical protein XELAEV_18009953mg [Xenopus laevis]
MGTKASKTTIAKWIRSTIIRAYAVKGKKPPLNVRAYSTRSLSTSWAVRHQASVEQESASSYPVLPLHVQGVDLNLPERNHPEGTDQILQNHWVPNGCLIQPEPPAPPPKPALKKSSLSACRYALSDGEPEEEEEEKKIATAGTGTLSTYTTLTRRPGRSCLTTGKPEKKVQRSQSFAVRAHRKRPPPPPPKRLSSMSSAEGQSPEGQSSVKTIAAQLEDIGKGTGFSASISKATHTEVLEGSGTRRRTVSESAAGLGRRLSLPLTTKKDEEEERKEEPISSQHSSSESIPFAEEGNLTIKQRPKPPGAKLEQDATSELGPTQESQLQSAEAQRHLKSSAVLAKPVTVIAAKPQIGPKPDTGARAPPATSIPKNEEHDFNLTESDTVKRRPKVKEKEEESPKSPLANNSPSLIPSQEPLTQDTLIAKIADIDKRLLSLEVVEDSVKKTGIDTRNTGVSISQTHLVISGPQQVLQKPSRAVTGPLFPAGSILWDEESEASSREQTCIPQQSISNSEKGPPVFTSSLQNTEELQDTREKSCRETVQLTKNILDDISTIFDDLAEQLEAMLD